MSELVLLFAALFLFCFGYIILSKLIEFGFAVADKALENSGKLFKLPFILVFKLSSLIFKFLFKKFNNKYEDQFSVRPIHITTLELQQMRKNNLRTGIKNMPVEIEYSQPNRLK